MMGVSEVAGSFEIIIVARFLVGICAGQLNNRMDKLYCIFKHDSV